MGNHNGRTHRGADAARVGARTTVGKSAKTPTSEELYARAAERQRTEHLLAEVQPGAEHAIGNIPGYRSNPFAVPSNQDIVTVFGEHQYGAILHAYTPGAIRGAALERGVKPGRSKAETISRMTAAATGGRYSANFPIQRSTGAKGGPRGRSSTGGRKAKAPTSDTRPELVPIGNMPAGYQSDPFSPPKPERLIQVFGRAQLARALDNYTVEALKETAAQYEAKHPGTKPTNRGQRAPLIAYIVAQYDKEQAR